jgi:hypothetical protein
MNEIDISACKDEFEALNGFAFYINVGKLTKSETEEIIYRWKLTLK